MLQRIRTSKELSPYLREVIEDAGIEVGVAENVSPEEYAAVKVDDYYAGQHMSTPPKSVDFVVTVDCQCDAYVMYILEFKNVSKASGLDIHDIQEKFQNTIDDFLCTRFASIYLDDKYKYKAIKLYLVSDAYGIGKNFPNFEEYRRVAERTGKQDTLKTEISLGSKIYRFKGKLLTIGYDIPPNPIIQKIL